MKYFFWLWLVPMTLFWGWFGLSYYDMNFGLLMFSRQIHDLVFGIYANMLGISYDAIVSIYIKACIFDSLLILSIIAFRRRKKIIAWWQSRNRNRVGQTVDDQSLILPAE